MWFLWVSLFGGQQPAAVTLTLSLVKPIESTEEAFDLDV